MKIDLELNFAGKSVFINFWNHATGKDVVCEVENGRLIHQQVTKDGKITRTRIGLTKFIKIVKERAGDEARL